MRPSGQSSISNLEIIKMKKVPKPKQSIDTTSVKSSIEKKTKVTSLKSSRAFIEETKNNKILVKKNFVDKGGNPSKNNAIFQQRDKLYAP